MSSPDFGIEVLYDPEGAKADVVFVHGLQGDRRDTWSKNGVLWPQMLLSADFPDVRILTFGHDSYVARLDESQVTQSNVKKHAVDLCARLAPHRDDGNVRDRPILFVAHSLGGLVCAEVMVMGDRGAKDDQMEAIARNTRGMIFMATPFSGSYTASLGGIMRSVVGIFRETNRNILGDLVNGSEELKSLNMAFPEVLRKRDRSGNRVEITFFIETLKTGGQMIVAEESAYIPGWGDRASIRADHRNICKFDTKEDEGYQLVKNAMEKMLKLMLGEGISKEGGSNYVHFNNQGARIANQGYNQTIPSQTINYN